jgi:hypothetical protein
MAKDLPAFVGPSAGLVAIYIDMMYRALPHNWAIRAAE